MNKVDVQLNWMELCFQEPLLMYKVAIGFFFNSFLLSSCQSLKKDVLYFKFVTVNVLVTNSVFLAYC